MGSNSPISDIRSILVSAVVQLFVSLNYLVYSFRFRSPVDDSEVATIPFIPVQQDYADTGASPLS